MTPVRQRWMLAGAGFLVLVFLVRAGIWAVAALGALGGRVEAKRILRAGLETEQRNLPVLEAEAADLRDTLETMTTRLLRGTTEAAAQADLSGRLGSTISRHHGRLIRFDPLPDSSEAGRLRRVRGKTVVETDFEGVAEILAALERLEVVLLPDRVVISAPEPDAGPESPERLEVELEISGWFLPREES